MTCTVIGCESEIVARGWCSSHYTRWRRHGDPEGGAPNQRGTVLQRFMDRVVVTDNCWFWKGGVSAKGYGMLSLKGEGYVSAHRFSYTHFIGPIPDGLQLDHLCRNRDCVRPDHLEAVTQTENVHRGLSFSAYNERKVLCVRGHDLIDPENSYGYKGRRQCKTCAKLAARAKFLDPETREAALAAKRENYRRNKARKAAMQN